MPTRAYAPGVGGPVSLSPAAIDACPSFERRLESADLMRLPWALLGDGVPRSRGTILAALADRHSREVVKRTLMRLAVTERLVETGGRYTLPTPEAEPGTAAGSVLVRPGRRSRQGVLAALLDQLLGDGEAHERAPDIVLQVPAGERGMRARWRTAPICQGR